VFGENVMYNALGENITKNFRRFREPDINSDASKEWFDQMAAGRGPVYLHTQESGETKNETMMFTLWDRPYGLPFWETNFRKCAEEGDVLEVVPALIGEQSPIKVGHDYQTNIAGLYAIGDTSYCGGTMPGAVPAPPGRNRGSGILNAVFSAIVCAEAAAGNVRSAAPAAIDPAQLESCRTRAFAPLDRRGGVHPKEVMNALLEIIGPMETSVYMNGYRLQIALRKLEAVKDLAKNMSADDFHWMLACHEADAMVLCAEMQLRASLMREESRGWFLREDFPEMDNDKWLKYIIVRNVNGAMTFSTEDVPVELWDVKPPVHRRV
jgi:succinate dehydrogenase/fumarate reductase flavoprotein subunit